MRSQAVIFYRAVYYIILLMLIILSLQIIKMKANEYQKYIELQFKMAFKKAPLLYFYEAACNNNKKSNYYLIKNLTIIKNKLCYGNGCVNITCPINLSYKNRFVNIYKSNDYVIIN